MANVKNFSVCADDYSNSLPEGEKKHYWEDGETDFGIYSNHLPEKVGYYFSYYANSEVAEEATKFMYVAVPKDWSTGRKAFLVDET